jgi:hypothetical protein
MNFDEISFVRAGANQEAHVALFKSDQDQEIRKGELAATELVSHATRLLATSDDMTFAQAISKTLEEYPHLYEEIMPVPISKQDVQELPRPWQLDELTKSEWERNPDKTWAQCMADVLERRPDLYRP